MTRSVPAAAAKARLSELVARVAHGGERIVIERHGRPVAALVSMDDLARIEAPEPGDDPWLRMLAEGGGVEDEVVDRMLAPIQAERARNAAPPRDLTD